MKLQSLALTAALALAACAQTGDGAKDPSSAPPPASSASASKPTAARPASTAAHVAKKTKPAPTATVAPTNTAAVPAVYVASDPPEDTAVPVHVATVPTVLSQGNSVAELKITAGIRRAVMFDFSLGLAARNIQIITMGTKVTLRGVVKSEHERSAIEAHAKQQNGVSGVDNMLALEN
jgi:hypothetical protein